MIKFDYTDAKGKESHRVVHVISSPSDSYLVYDLTEFDAEERQYYEQALEDLKKVYQEEIKQLGLSQNFRRFKEANIQNLEK